MSYHMIWAKLMRPTRKQYEEGLINAGNAVRDDLKQSQQDKREVIQRYAEIILMNDENNYLASHEIAEKAIELYNKIEEYL